MEKFLIKRLGIIWRVNPMNFNDEKVFSKFPSKLNEGESVDIDLFFWRKEKDLINEEILGKELDIKKMESFCQGFISDHHDISRRKVLCCFDKELAFSHVLSYEVNQSFQSFYGVLGVFFLHSSSVVSGNKIYLFVAPSDGGKSTIAELARNKGFKVLDEESCILKKKEDKYFAQSFPVVLFPGLVEDEREVGGVFFLKKALTNRIKEISTIDALKKIIPETEGLYDSIVPEEHRILYKKNTFDLVNSFLNQVHFRLLEFNKKVDIDTCLKI